MLNNKAAGLVTGVVALLLVFGAAPAQAQSADADAFIGKWTLAFEGAPGGGQGGPGGGGPGAGPGGGGGGGGMGARGMGGAQVLEISRSEGRLVGKLTGGMGGEQTIDNITVSDESLVLVYQLSMQGQAMPITLRLTPDAEVTRATLDLAGRFTRIGTATKQE